MNCFEIRRLCYAYLDGELPGERRASVETHLAQCEGCAERFAGERLFLDLVARSADETAPASLRERVRGIVDGTWREDTPVRSIGGGGWVQRFAAPLAAAAVVAVVVLQSGERPGLTTAVDQFAADHVRHAAVWPDVAPFPADTDVPDAPVIEGGDLEGRSRCLIEGRVYAHYVYDVGGEKMSVYLPTDASPPPTLDASVGRVSIVATEGGAHPAVLVSNQMSADQMSAVWTTGS